MTNEPYLVKTDQDKDAITALHSLCFYNTDLLELQVALDDKNCFAFLVGCDEDEQPVGYIVCRVQDEDSFTLWCSIRPEQRKKGYARILWAAAFSESRARNTETISLYVAEDNPSAIRLHKSLGFVTVDRLDGFYADMSGGAVNANIMQASLIKNKIQESESDKDKPYLVTTDQDRDAITALHSICFEPSASDGSSEWARLQAALEDENCFALLAGCDEDGKPAGYQVCRVVGKESEGMWTGVRPERRGEGWGRKFMAAGMDEARARGAEVYYGTIAELGSSINALRIAKSLGFVTVDYTPDFAMEGGERHEFTRHHIRASLIKKENQEKENQKDEPYLVKTDQDKDAITALHSICFDSSEWARLQAVLDDKNCFAFLVGCDEDEQPAGLIVCRVVDKESALLWTAVRPERQRQGWARILTFAAFNEARIRGAEMIECSIVETNVPPTIAAKNCGFVHVASVPDFYFRNDEKICCTTQLLRRSLITGK